MPKYLRYMVVTSGQSSLNASYTPTYFKEGEYRKAKQHADQYADGYVVDLFKRLNQHDLKEHTQ